MPTLLPPPATPPARTLPPQASLVTRWALQLLAGLSLALGIIGIFVPLLPTTPFILLSAWAAARSSPRLLAWLEKHALFGAMILDWRRGGVVRRRAKWAATAVMASSAVLLLWWRPMHWATAMAIICMTCTLGWLWRRPESYREDAPATIPPQP